MHVQSYEVEVQTDGDGNASVSTPALNGLLDRIQYVKDGSNGFADGVDFTVTMAETGEALWSQEDVNASAVVAPRQAVHGTDGGASLYADAGEAVLDRIAVKGPATIAIADGGANKVAVFRIVTI